MGNPKGFPFLLISTIKKATPNGWLKNFYKRVISKQECNSQDEA